MVKQTLLALGAAALLAGCATTNKVSKDENQIIVADQVAVSVFVDKEGGIYTLNTTDLYETAKLTDTEGKIYSLKREPSANGIRLVDGDTEVFFRGDTAFLTINGKEIPVTVKKD